MSTDIRTDDPLTESTRWLVALDVDGTVLHEDGTCTDAVRDAAARVSAAGHEIMLATGRSWETTAPVLGTLGISPEYVVCANGALVMKRDASEPDGYRRHLIETFDPSDVLKTIAGSLSDGRYMVEYPDGFRRYTQGMVDWNLDNAEMVPFERLLHEPVTRVVVVSPEHDEAEFLKIVESMGLHQVTYAIGWTAWLDIAPLGVNKATALQRVREWSDIPPSRVLVAGDGRNDIEMLTWASAEGRAVAMGQAPDEVKDAATEVTASVVDDGLAAALLTLPGVSSEG